MSKHRVTLFQDVDTYKHEVMHRIDEAGSMDERLLIETIIQENQGHALTALGDLRTEGKVAYDTDKGFYMDDPVDNEELDPYQEIVVEEVAYGGRLDPEGVRAFMNRVASDTRSKTMHAVNDLMEFDHLEYDLELDLTVENEDSDYLE